MDATKEVHDAQEARQLPDPQTIIQTLQSDVDNSRKEAQHVNAGHEQLLREKLALNATLKEQESEYQHLQQQRSELELYASLQRTLIYELDQTGRNQQAINLARRKVTNQHAANISHQCTTYKYLQLWSSFQLIVDV